MAKQGVVFGTFYNTGVNGIRDSLWTIRGQLPWAIPIAAFGAEITLFSPEIDFKPRCCYGFECYVDKKNYFA